MPATPQDRKRPKSEASTTPATFDHDGDTYTLPARTEITAGMMRRHRTEAELDFMFSLLEETCDKDTLAALDAKTLDELNEIVGDWGDHVFGGDAGKS